MIDKITELIKPVIVSEKAELIDITYRKESGSQVLRLLVDKDGGIKLSECVRLNQIISRVLEDSGVIAEDYVLEVDSPGVDRPFKTKMDYARAAGRMVRVTLNEAILDKKEYIGRLQDIMDDSIRVDVGKKGIIEVPFSKITRARQEVEF
ncbi:MAG: ribosome maturation factor RimP [Candidatus Omnitrophica bacterium]|nr:ribosome maturation factor RimP [Candidatus Omnitrophota bacterium]